MFNQNKEQDEIQASSNVIFHIQSWNGQEWMFWSLFSEELKC